MSDFIIINKPAPRGERLLIGYRAAIEAPPDFSAEFDLTWLVVLRDLVRLQWFIKSVVGPDGNPLSRPLGSISRSRAILTLFQGDDWHSDHLVRVCGMWPGGVRLYRYHGRPRKPVLSADQQRELFS